MTLPSTSIEERRKFPRSDSPVRFDVSLLQPEGSIPANPVNVGEGGLCFRLEETLEVRALVRLQLTPERLSAARGPRPLECSGRVAWVVQRLDLRSTPPFLYDIGVEFVDPPPILRQWVAQRSGGLMFEKRRILRERRLPPATIRGRLFVPRLEHESNHPSRWHLVVSVDGAPCFSGHYAGERAAVSAWDQFKRRQTRR